MRLFIGIFPPKQYLDYFRDVMREFSKEKRNLKPINLEQIHLTMRFIGPNVSLGSKNKIAAELVKNAGQFPRPLIHMEKLRFGFPRQHDPRVLLAEIERTDDLDELTNKLHKIVRHVGQDDTILWKSHLDKEYHMSVARLKDAATRSTGRDVKEILNGIDLIMPDDFQAEEMYLVQSEMTPQGPIYKKLEQIKL